MSEQSLREIATTLREMLRWSRFAGMQQLRSILSQNLKTDTEKTVFELSDGSRSTRDIAKLAGLGSNATIAQYWKKWSKMGIVEPSREYQGRYERVCSLEQVGMEVPSMPAAAPQTKPESTEPTLETTAGLKMEKVESNE